MFVPKFGLRVNYKPLIPLGELDKFRPEKVLERTKKEILKAFKTKLLQETFTPQAKKRLAEAIEVKVGRRSVTVISRDPAFLPLLGGQKSSQMRWLTKAARPIPIVTDSGKVIFRWATPRSMANGSWYHPGRKATTVLERARKEARAVIRARLQKELRRHLAASIAKGAR